MDRSCLIFVLALGAACTTGGPQLREPHDGYLIRRSIPLRTIGDPTARLELLEDDRITPPIRAHFQRGLPDDACRGTPADSMRVFCRTIAKEALRPALLRLVDTTGKELDTIALDRPIANLDVAIPGAASAAAVYGVTVDMSAGIGSYSGPLLQLLDLSNRHLAWLRARDAATDSMVSIFLPSTLKTAWRIVPTLNGGHEILMVACRPDFNVKTGGFETTYFRFAMDHGEWRRYERAETGIWEDDGPFPARSSFP